MTCIRCGTTYPAPDTDGTTPHGVVTYRRGQWRLICTACIKRAQENDR